MKHYFMEIWSADFIGKFPLAAATGFYVNILHGDWVLFLIFLCMTTIDLLFGSAWAIMENRFSPRRFSKWTLKMIAYCGCIMLIGAASASILRATGINLPVLNFFVMLLIFNEVSSILINMRDLGLPVPPVALKIVGAFRQNAEKKIDEVLDLKGAVVSDVDNYSESSRESK